VTAMGERTIDIRDRAVLLDGFAGGFRRSELVGVDVEDIDEQPEGLAIDIRRSKRDQEAKGRTVAIVYGTDTMTCPVRALRTWLAIADITTGAVFRPVDRHGNVVDRRLTPQSVALVVKRHMGPLGYDLDDFAGHSLRRGMATTASRNGARDRTIMDTTGHASTATLSPYIDEAQRFNDPASGYLEL
jgi:integrase